ncbi:MAG TPA: hypothetical protein VHZ24_00895 [Pirellulales bacterium]|jgi:hypothetical protein|nr:hypothetical protein [Pirellulales bacterium]
MNAPAIPILLAEVLTRREFELGRIQSPTDYLLPAVVFVTLAVYVVTMYRRDTSELGAGWSVLLITLRMTALASLAVIYLQPQWRHERDDVQTSRVVMLADTSLSMATDDDDATPSEPNRAQQLAAMFGDGKLLGALRRVHDVAVYRFDADVQPIVTLERLAEGSASEASGRTTPVDWAATLSPRGPETRLGQALRQLLNDQRTAPLAGVVVWSDGQQNAGPDAASAIPLAKELGVPIYAVGIGSSTLPVNVRVSDFVVPARAYPGDAFNVTGYVQAVGMAGKSATVELLSRPGTGDDKTAARLEGTQQVVLGSDAEPVPVKFEITPGEAGRRTLLLRVRPPVADRIVDDNQREASVEVVDRRSRVLLFAGGPAREYQFLRNVLRRDKDVEVDVLLQTGSEGVSQDAHQILDEFPTTREALFAYDAIVAFDSDWRDLDASQVEMLERWVANEAGGLIVVAGPIFMDAWLQSPALEKIRALYPVEFNRRFAVVEDARFGAKQPWPLEFTRDGLDAQFLWLGDTASASAAAWADFKGVFGYYDVRGPKLGATVFARFSDPRTAIGDQLPVYMAGQYFGSGQVFYLGSGEMWRLRSDGDGLFESFYTKLLRHVSQGRLLRGSSRGVLLTEGDRFVPGDTVEVRAQLTDAKLDPLELPNVPVTVIAPDGSLDNSSIARDANRPGSYRGSFVVRKEGSYRLELVLPESDGQRLAALPIQVTVPDLERAHTERNDAVLSELSRQTGGQYYVGFKAAGALPEALRDASRTTTLAAAPERLWDKPWMLALVCGALCCEWFTRRLLKLA